MILMLMTDSVENTVKKQAIARSAPRGGDRPIFDDLPIWASAVL